MFNATLNETGAFKVNFQFKDKNVDLWVERIPAEGEAMYWDLSIDSNGCVSYFSGHFIVSQVQTRIEGDYPKHTVSYIVHLTK